MKSADTTKLSRRERQIMEIVFRFGEATAQQVQTEMDDSPSYSTVRSLLVILEKKGFLKHEKKRSTLQLPSHPPANRSRTNRHLATRSNLFRWVG